MSKSKKPGAQSPPDDELVETGGSQTTGGGNVAEGQEPDAVIEPGPGEVESAIASLGDSVRQAEGSSGGYDLSEEAHRSAIERAEQAATDWVLDPESLVADARDCMIEQIKRRPKPWGILSPAEQRDVAAACEHAAQEIVRKVVEAIAARGQEPVRVLLQKVTLGDEIQITGKVKPMDAAEEDAAVTLLHHARGKHVMLTVASKDDSHDREAETDEEEPQLGFEAGSDEITDEDLAEDRELEPGPPVVLAEDDQLATGDVAIIGNQDGTACEVQINLKTGMVEAKHPLRDEFDIDVREATPVELAAERERTADFDESGGERQAGEPAV